jgi:hypothetical protein
MRQLNYQSVTHLAGDCAALLSQWAEVQSRIKEKLAEHADGKTLKGNEIVAWLGEIYAKLLLDGALVAESEEHDLMTPDGSRVSVKTRRGSGSGWRQSSAIPKIEGHDCPTHLLFVHLNDDYSIDRMWLLEWSELQAAGRFREHVVRGHRRSFIFNIDERRDAGFVVYPQPSVAESGQGAVGNDSRQTMITGGELESRSPSVPNASAFQKLYKIGQWALKPAQLNHKIIQAFRRLEREGSVERSQLRRYCLENLNMPTFESNFAQMKTDSGNSNGKIFFEMGSRVYIYDEARCEVARHFPAS